MWWIRNKKDNGVFSLLFLSFTGVLICLFSYLSSSSAETITKKDISANLEHRYVTSSGIRFHYVTKGSGQPLILLHGFPETWYSWRKNIDALAQYFRVIALDLKGYGDTDKPVGDYSLPTLSKEIAGLIKTLGLEKPILVGHDWGGIYSLGCGKKLSGIVG
jgi:hypothetical protein